MEFMKLCYIEIRNMKQIVAGQNHELTVERVSAVETKCNEINNDIPVQNVRTF